MNTYTFLVTCSVTIQHTFAETELENEARSDASLRTPMPEALGALAQEIEALVGEHCAVSSCRIDAESLVLLGNNSD